MSNRLLTRRENIYLNGAIMGMNRGEIQRKFDEIVAFADLEDWIDTPIKRYSSDMHVRLGFTVAAHLDPEILLIDEVLAQGEYCRLGSGGLGGRPLYEFTALKRHPSVA